MHSISSRRAYWYQVVFLGLIVGVGLQLAQAWTAPGGTPPNGNVSGPVTLGSVTQVKSGSLGLLGNLSVNMVQLNTVVVENAACTSNGLLARDAVGVLLSCQSGLWKKAGGSVAGDNFGNHTATQNITMGTNSICFGASCRNSWPNGLPTGTYGFGGAYTVRALDTRQCQTPNPLTGACSCPSGTTARAFKIDAYGGSLTAQSVVTTGPLYLCF